MFGICSNFSIIVFEALGRCNDERKIDPFKYGLGAFDAGAAKFSDIINTSGVDEDYGADGGEFTGISTGSVVVPGTSETMEMCWCVNALASELLPALRRPKRPIWMRRPLGVSSMVNSEVLMRGAA